MPFQQFVCWDPVWAERVMNTEALQPPTHVFLAVHHPVQMFRTTLTALYKGQSTERGASLFNEQQFLDELLRPKDFAFVPVLGNAGTGKSHLVRWLAVNIPPSPNRHVLLVPKVDTNLWDVIDRVLKLPGVRDDPQFDDYRSRLRRATSELRSEKEAREKILNNLAVACGPNGPHKLQGLTEVQSDLVQQLPNLLYDPFFRETLLQDGGVIDQLVRHTIGTSATVERLEEKRGFKEEDLPLRVSDIKRASLKARSFFSQLVGDTTKTLHHEVVQWLNFHLSAAITELLELRGDALLKLMLDVRSALAAQEMELILLIEDFAKLQGIDMQLLEAIIARPHQEGRERLCPMRTVLACTKGYFGTLFDTVQTRVDFCVTLDPPGDAGEAMPESEVEQFVARYLNAVRLPEEDLVHWLESNQVGEANATEPPPTACSGCEYRTECHEAFGERGGIGLYPFNAAAVARMSERASPEGFNPRFVIKDVLKAVLVTYAGDFRDGKFPPPALLDHFRNPRLSPTLKDDLKRRDQNPATRERRLALIDLWTTSERVVDLHPGVHEAFNLPPLGAPPPQPPTIPPIPPPPTLPLPPEPPRPTPPTSLPEKLRTQLRQLEEWQNRGSLAQTLTQELRVALFSAISSRINWDAEILVEGYFSNSTDPKRPFRQRSINFERQLGQRQQAIVQLTVPVDHKSFTDAALAIQGLLLFSHYGNWRFQYGGQPGAYYLRKYAQQLDTWAHAVLEQLRRPTKSGSRWNPAPAAAEILALAARMANRPAASKAATDDQVSALFERIDRVECDHRSAAWKELFKSLQANHEALKDILRSHIGCTKGGSSKIQVLDAGQLLEPLRALRKDWHPKIPIPTDLWDIYASIRKAREKIDALLSTAVEEERERHATWLTRLRQAIESEVGRDDVVSEVRDVMQAARDEGVFPGGIRERLEATLDAFSRMRFDQGLDAIKRIQAETKPADLLIELGRDYGDLMKTADEFVTLVTQFLEQTLRRVETDIAQLEGAGELKATEQSIAEHLDQLRALANDLGGTT